MRGVLMGLILAAAATPALAQSVAPAAPSPPSWRLQWDGNLFLQFNYQQRKFTDFHAVESQNWFSVAIARDSARGGVEAAAMFSLEALTLHDLGSPQVFQTGETFASAPLIDYQHPHDFVMELGVRLRRTAGALLVHGQAALVGAPALGPAPYMHRASAEPNPTAPLAHHYLDSTHITPGVVTAGLTAGGFTFEASGFHGREPDEDRFDIDLGPIDSFAARGAWTRGPWAVQFSGASLESPEAIEPFVDAVRLTASMGFDSTASGGRLAALVAWGQTREIYGNTDGYLAEAAWHASAATTWYGRAEWVTKNILTAGGGHPPGFRHAHVFSRVGALTIGWRRAIVTRANLAYFVGADVTAHHTPPNLVESYGQPWSYRVYLQLRPLRALQHRH